MKWSNTELLNYELRTRFSAHDRWLAVGRLISNTCHDSWLFTSFDSVPRPSEPGRWTRRHQMVQEFKVSGVLHNAKRTILDNGDYWLVSVRFPYFINFVNLGFFILYIDSWRQNATPRRWFCVKAWNNSERYLGLLHLFNTITRRTRGDGLPFDWLLKNVYLNWPPQL